MVHITHASTFLIDLFRSFNFRQKVEMNRSITQANAAKEARRQVELAKPDAADRLTISPNASLVTINPVDYSDGSMAGFPSGPAAAAAAVAPAQPAPRDFQRGNVRAKGQQPLIKFSHLLVELNTAKLSLSLVYFTQSNLEILLHEAATLPLKKINPIATEKNTPRILDALAFAARAGTDEAMPFGAWLQAVPNFLRFIQQNCTTAFYDLWTAHFGFFSNAVHATFRYDDWKDLERDLRKEIWSSEFEYDEDHYASKYDKALERADYRRERASDTEKLRADLERERSHVRSETRGRSEQEPVRPRRESSSNHPSHHSFPSGSGSNSSSTVCFLCRRAGHRAYDHVHGSRPETFESGKPTFCTISGKSDFVIRSSRSEHLCYYWNSKGACNSERHPPGPAKLHRCMFCGGPHPACSCSARC